MMRDDIHCSSLALSIRGCIGPQDEDKVRRIGHLREQEYQAQSETSRDAPETRIGAQHTDDGDDIQNGEL